MVSRQDILTEMPGQVHASEKKKRAFCSMSQSGPSLKIQKRIPLEVNVRHVHTV